jgi:hypothetical protein
VVFLFAFALTLLAAVLVSGLAERWFREGERAAKHEAEARA